MNLITLITILIGAQFQVNKMVENDTLIRKKYLLNPEKKEKLFVNIQLKLNELDLGLII